MPRPVRPCRGEHRHAGPGRRGFGMPRQPVGQLRPGGVQPGTILADNICPHQRRCSLAKCTGAHFLSVAQDMSGIIKVDIGGDLAAANGRDFDRRSVWRSETASIGRGGSQTQNLSIVQRFRHAQAYRRQGAAWRGVAAPCDGACTPRCDALADYARRQRVPPGPSSRTMPVAASSSRMRSDSAKFLLARAAVRAATSSSTHLESSSGLIIQRFGFCPTTPSNLA